ncbi:MAG: CHASE domain-containing protein [Gammaproteobacteria bacterium]|nr:CHASE domain-containing protein [Gammaproteobacteria bacterium]
MKATDSPSLFARLLALTLLSVGYFAVARLSLFLAFEGSNASPVWPPTGLAMAALSILGLRLWPAVWLGAFTANLAGFHAGNPELGQPFWLASASIALGNTAEACTAAWLLRYRNGLAAALNTQAGVFRFVAIVLAACVLSAVTGTASLVQFGIVPRELASTVLWTWWLGDVCGGLILLPLALAWRRGASAPRPRRSWREQLLLASALLLCVYGIFVSGWLPSANARPFTFLLFPLLAWAALRHGLRGATSATIVIAIGSVWGSTRGQGPFAGGTLNESLILLDSFLALCACIALALAADRHERQDAGLHAETAEQAIPWLALLGSLGITIGAWQVLAREAEVQAQQRLDTLSREVEDGLRGRLNDLARVLHSCAGLFAASQRVDRREWRTFIDSLNIEKNLPGVQGIGYAAYLRPEELPALLQTVRADGFPDFQLKPAGERPEYSSIIYLEPFEQRNLRAFGYDMLSEPTRRAAMLAARDRQEVTLSGRVVLVQEDETEPLPGFLMYFPVYRNGEPTATLEQRRQALAGYVYAPLRAPYFVEALLGTRWPDIELSLFDGDAVTPEERLFGDADPASLNAKRQALRQLDWHGHRWTLHLQATPQFEAGIDRDKSQLVFVAGAVVSLLLFAIVRAQSLTGARAQALAKAMTSELSTREQRFRTLFETASDAILIVIEGRVSDCNPATLHMLACSCKQEVLNKTLLEMSPPQQPDDQPSGRGLGQAMRELRHAGSYSFEWNFLRWDGSRFLAQVTGTVVANPDKREEVHLLWRDITRQRAWEDGLRQAKEAAEANSKLKSDFVANISHELRTPMNAILGMTQMLEKSSMDLEQRKHVGMIHSAGTSLLSLLNDILDFSKIEAGKMAIECEPFLLDKVIEALAAIMGATARHKPLDLMIGQDPSLPDVLLGDALRLQQVLINLISNALKFTQEGQIALLVARVPTADGRLRLAFRVRDTGIGISPEQAERLFCAFTQADPSTTRKFGGSGLGLVISKQLVEMMGGEIRLSSEPGHGTEFCVELPFQEAEAPTAQPSSKDEPLRVRLVDPDPESRAYLQATIESWGWPVSLQEPGEAQAGHEVLIYNGAAPHADAQALRRQLGLDGPEERRPILRLVNPYEREHLDPSSLAAANIRLAVKPLTGRSLREALQDSLKPAGMTVAPALTVSADLPLQGCHILLVEDNELNQAVACGLLEHAGATLEITSDGQQAVERMSRDGKPFDLVLMDVHMPVMDGMSATRVLRQQLGLRLPIIAMTAAVMASEQAAYREAGMDEVIAKPFEAETLVAVIGRLLKRAPAAAAPGLLSSTSPLALDKLQALMQRSPSTRPQLRALLNGLRGTVPDKWREVRRLWDEGEGEKAWPILHTLKGSLGMFTDKAFVDAMTSLEAVVRAHDAQRFEQEYAVLDQVLKSLLGELEAWLLQTAG